MSGFKQPDLPARREAAARAKKAALEKFRAAATDPALADRLTERAVRAADRETSRNVRAAKMAEERSREAERKQQAEREAALQAERAAAENAERERALEAERKAARDARYAARKNRNAASEARRVSSTEHRSGCSLTPELEPVFAIPKLRLRETGSGRPGQILKEGGPALIPVRRSKAPRRAPAKSHRCGPLGNK